MNRPSQAWRSGKRGWRHQCVCRVCVWSNSSMVRIEAAVSVKSDGPMRWSAAQPARWRTCWTHPALVSFAQQRQSPRRSSSPHAGALCNPRPHHPAASHPRSAPPPRQLAAEGARTTITTSRTPPPICVCAACGCWRDMERRRWCAEALVPLAPEPKICLNPIVAAICRSG